MTYLHGIKHLGKIELESFKDFLNVLTWILKKYISIIEELGGGGLKDLLRNKQKHRIIIINSFVA